MPALLVLLTMLGCGSPDTPPIRPTATPPVPGGTGATIPPVSTTKTAACADLKNDTPLSAVTPACGQVWTPYQVTVVPPNDQLVRSMVPVPPLIGNHTGGAVKDADAALWAAAFNRQAAWYSWAVGDDQVRFIPAALEAPNLFAGPVAGFLQAGGHILEPACDLYPVKLDLFPVDAAAKAFFLHNAKATAGNFVIVATYADNCSVPGVTRDKKHVTVASWTKSIPALFAGAVVDDPVLGPIWKPDVALTCSYTGAPVAWCPAP